MGEPMPDVITFDCYGTLIDWERGILDAFAREAYRSGTTFDGPAIVAAYHELEPRVEAEPFRPYREVLTEMARRVADVFGWEIEPDRLGLAEDQIDVEPALHTARELIYVVDRVVRKIADLLVHPDLLEYWTSELLVEPIPLLVRRNDEEGIDSVRCYELRIPLKLTGCTGRT